MASCKALIIMSIVLLMDGRPREVVADPVRSAKCECRNLKCECAIFKFPTVLTTRESPLLAKTYQFHFECNDDGKESCSNFCRNLSQAFKKLAPKRICQLIRNTDTPFVPMIYYKTSDDDVWTFTGLKSTLNICCKKRIPTPCA